MIKNILFDFDGTIANTAQGIVATMAETFRRMDLNIPTQQAMQQTIGMPLIKALQSLNNLSDHDAQRAVTIYADLFRVIEINHTTIYPNVQETLQQLNQKGVRMAIVTSRNRESLELILKRFGLIDFFEILLTNDDRTSQGNNNGEVLLRPKPAPDMVLALLTRMNISPSETLVVGDTTFDIEMGNAANCTTCAVTYGNHTIDQLLAVSPTHIVHDFADLISFC